MTDESVTELVRQRSMLIILVAACTSALSTFEAANETADKELCVDLARVIDRSKAELDVLSRKIGLSSGTKEPEVGTAS